MSSDLLQLLQLPEIKTYAEKMAAEIPTGHYSKPELGSPRRRRGQDAAVNLLPLARRAGRR